MIDSNQPLDANRPAHAQMHPISTAAFARRFTWWTPQIMLHLKRQGTFSSAEFDSLRSIHHSRIITCHTLLRIEMRVIRRLELDSPLLTDEEWRKRITDHKTLAWKIRSGRQKGKEARSGK